MNFASSAVEYNSSNTFTRYSMYVSGSLLLNNAMQQKVIWKSLSGE